MAHHPWPRPVSCWRQLLATCAVLQLMLALERSRRLRTGISSSGGVPACSTDPPHGVFGELYCALPPSL